MVISYPLISDVPRKVYQLLIDRGTIITYLIISIILFTSIIHEYEGSAEVFRDNRGILA